jgi:hypothetical protein
MNLRLIRCSVVLLGINRAKSKNKYAEYTTAYCIKVALSEWKKTNYFAMYMYIYSYNYNGFSSI